MIRPVQTIISHAVLTLTRFTHLLVFTWFISLSASIQSTVKFSSTGFNIFCLSLTRKKQNLPLKLYKICALFSVAKVVKIYFK